MEESFKESYEVKFVRTVKINSFFDYSVAVTVSVSVREEVSEQQS